ncbi:MAG: N-6 DNA methylase [Flavobacteriales bacterium]|nr:N-6 DNA methylase [Flavobacteriales bacterium]
MTKKHRPPAYKIEDHVNDWVKAKFDELGLKNQQDYYTESAIPDYLKEALKGRAKTKNKTSFGKPDFSLPDCNPVPVIIENKLGLKKLLAETKDGVKFDASSVQNYAANGALYYATGIIASGKYHEAIAIGIAGDSDKAIEIKVYYVYGSGEKSYKLLDNVTTLDFLENEQTFETFYKNATLTEDEKHEILINSQAALQKYAKELNKLMHNHNITAPQRVLYVSGMLLSMQHVTDKAGNHIQEGLVPDDLKGIQTESKRDGVQIVDQIKEFLTARNIPADKQSLMLSSFSEISKDKQRDEVTELEKQVSKLINDDASCNKQIFTFIYYNIFLSIDAMAGHIDIMGEMYSEFLKYALGDGKEIGIVLTPPYITKMMTTILGVNKDSRVMDLATGSAGFLISAMEMMIEDADKTSGKKTSAAERKIKQIKKEQLMGIELNAEMFTLAATNMILRGDGSSNIQKGSTFKTPEHIYDDFKADRLLLNPPFSYSENGMPFIAFGLDKMQPSGLGAIIIQDSAGSGKATKTNKALLKKHTLLASIKMPMDLFQPMAGVQTSIYIFEAHKPHDFDATVKFMDFRNDGYKRTSRKIQEIDNPALRYADMIKIYKAGKNAKIEAAWDLDSAYIEDFITNSGADWNFDQHQIIDTKPTLEDFKSTVSDFLAWEVGNLLKNGNNLGK